MPIAISLINQESNLEDIDAETVSIKCVHCQHSEQTPAVTAKRHYVDEWPFEDLP